MTIKRFAEIIIELFGSFILFGFIIVAFHEWVHAVVLRTFGGEGYVVFYWFSGYVIIIKPPPTLLGQFLTALSGGVGCFLFCLVLDLKWLEEPADRWFRVPCRFHIASQIVYGIGEGLWFIGIITTEAFIIVFAISWIIGAIYGGFQFLKALEAEMYIGK